MCIYANADKTMKYVNIKLLEGLFLMLMWYLFLVISKHESLFTFHVILTLLNLIQPYNVGALSLIRCSVSSGGLFGTGAIAQQVVSSAARI